MQTAILGPLEVVEEAYDIFCHPARPITDSVNTLQ